MMLKKYLADREKFGSGPWEKEADHYQWIDPSTGYDCHICRHPDLGHLCGYVGIPRIHALYKKNYDEMAFLNVHGGITFSDFEEEYLFNSELWYIGFYCGHFFDCIPHIPIHHDLVTYKDFDYVKKEVEFLANQLKEHEILRITKQT